MSKRQYVTRLIVPLTALALLAASLAHAQQAQPDGNGIVISDVKIYDNAALQQMLDNARARLASMQFLDQTGIAARLGTIQGSSMQQSGLSFNVGGPPLPGVQSTLNTGNTATTSSQGTNAVSSTGSSTTTNGSTTSSVPATGSSTTEQLQVTGPSTSTTTTNNGQTVVTGPSTQTVTTLAQQNPMAAPAPALSTFTLPSSFSPSASSILNEQVQLNSEVAGLALLLEGSLSDQASQMEVKDKHGKVVEIVNVPKFRTTIGIPVSIIPSAKHKDCVAEIVLTVKTESTQAGRPTITAILPQDKTYNVATINSKSIGIGGGVVTGVLTAGVNWAWQKQTYYIVQDQDTVALQMPDPADPNSISFGWQLRPVLGRRTVTGGMRTLFVQLALPLDFSTPEKELGTVTVTTSWKKINHKFNTVSHSAIDSVENPKPFPILNIVLTPRIQAVSDPIDNSDGTVTVHIDSNSYLQGTYIKIGGNTISQGASNAFFDPSHIDFTVPASLLATHAAFLVDRSGAYKQIVEPQIGEKTDYYCLDLNGLKVAPESSATAMLTAGVALKSDTEPCKSLLGNAKLSELHLIALVGSKVFGYRDAPINIDDSTSTISFRASVDLLRNSPSLTVERILWGEPFKATAALNVPLIPTIDKTPVVSKSADNIQVALIGSNLQQLTPPQGMKFNASGKSCSSPGPLASDDSNTGRILCVPQNLATTLSQIALRSTSGDLLLLAMPADPTTGTPTLQTHDPIQAGHATTLTVKGSKLDGFEGVAIGKTKIPAAKLSGNKKSIDVPLSAKMVQAPSIELLFSFKDAHPVSYTVSVFDKALEVSQPQLSNAGQQTTPN
ncbi:MAG: hypothetical protein ABR990_11200 [Terracidiphilus sp.]